MRGAKVLAKVVASWVSRRTVRPCVAPRRPMDEGSAGKVAPAAVAEFCGPRSRVDDVGEQDGGEHPVDELNGWRTCGPRTVFWYRTNGGASGAESVAAWAFWGFRGVRDRGSRRLRRVRLWCGIGALSAGVESDGEALSPTSPARCRTTSWCAVGPRGRHSGSSAVIMGFAYDVEPLFRPAEGRQAGQLGASASARASRGHCRLTIGSRRGCQADGPYGWSACRDALGDTSRFWNDEWRSLLPGLRSDLLPETVGPPVSRQIGWMWFRPGWEAVWFCDRVLTLGGAGVMLTFCNAFAAS
jgi:hypothetical protein